MTSVDKVYEKEKQDAVEKERFEKYQAISLCQDNIIDLLDNKFDKVPVNLVKEIKKIQDVNTLKLISKKIMKSNDIKEIEEYREEIANS